MRAASLKFFYASAIYPKFATYPSKQGRRFGPLMRSLPREWAPEEAANLESVIITALPSEFERQSPFTLIAKVPKKYWHQPNKMTHDPPRPKSCCTFIKTKWV